MSTPRKSSKPISSPQRPLLPRRQISSMQIVFGSMLAISLLLAINFSGRITAGRRIEAERDLMEQTIKTLQARATERASELGYFSSDDFVQKWARGEGRMVKQNEMLVVVVPGRATPFPTATPYVPPAAAQEAKQENWELWWSLFFDSPPPKN